MESFAFSRFAISVSVATALLAGCGSQLPVGAPGSSAQSAAAARPRQALLYVAHNDGYKSHEKTGITILTFPQGNPVASIRVYGYIGGLCSDSSGDVWMPYSSHGAFVDEFAHGGTKPIAQFRLRKGSIAEGCAIDPTSGDLAVMSYTGTYRGSVSIWKGAGKGKPALYRTPFVAKYGAYDGAGNLYIDGFHGGSDFWLVFGELPSGSGSVVPVSLDRFGDAAGGVQWDGTYVDVATDLNRREYPSRIFQVAVSGSSGHVAGAVHVKDMSPTSPIYLDGTEIIGIVATESFRQRAATWPYPKGGRSSKYAPDFYYVAGVTISK